MNNNKTMIDQITKTKKVISTKIIALAGIGFLFAGILGFTSYQRGYIVKATVTSGQVINVMNDNPISGVTVSLTNQVDHLVYTATTDSNGKYFIIDLPDGTYNFYVDGSMANYYDWVLKDDFGITINSNTTLEDTYLVPIREADMDKDWDCTAQTDFSITTQNNNFSLKNTVDQYFILVDQYFAQKDDLTQEELDALLDTIDDYKMNNFLSESAGIMLKIEQGNDQEYLDNNYASTLFDQFICYFRKESALRIDADKYRWVSNSHWFNNGHRQITTNLSHYYPPFETNYNDFNLLFIVKELFEKHPTEINQELLDNKIFEKLNSVIEYESEYAEEGEAINENRPHAWWNEYAEILASNEIYIFYPHFFPSMENRLFPFYLDGINKLTEIISKLTSNNEAPEIAVIINNINFFENYYNLLTLHSMHDSNVPSYRPRPLQTIKEVLEKTYPYVYENQWVQKIANWCNTNKVITSDFWQYNASPKRFDAYEENLILISNLFDIYCSDGTLYGQCSAFKPQYCSDGELINNCSECGCFEGSDGCQADETCNVPTPIKPGTRPTITP